MVRHSTGQAGFRGFGLLHVAVLHAAVCAGAFGGQGRSPDSRAGSTRGSSSLCPICWSMPSPTLRRFGQQRRLTDRELQVARCVAVGNGNHNVASHLGISRRTVEAHLRSVYEKLSIHNRTQLAHMVHAVEPARGDPPRPDDGLS